MGRRFWVLHVDVPAGVLIESSDQVFETLPCIHNDPAGPAVKTSLPVFRSLVPAGVRQVKLGTDLGAVAMHHNAMIYNGGNQTATASIEVRRNCDDHTVDSRTVTIEPRKGDSVQRLHVRVRSMHGSSGRRYLHGHHGRPA